MPSIISSDKVKSRHFHLTKGFIDDVFAINNGRELRRCFCDISSKDFELNFEHQSDHATFLNLDITIKEGIFT